MKNKFLLLLILASCSRDFNAVIETSYCGLTQVVISPLETTSLHSRSILSEDAEDMISDATVAAYDAETAMLSDVIYSESVPYLTLDNDRGYHIYAVANMGDLSSSFPVRESDVPLLRYTLPSFAEVGDRGIPMAGMVATEWTSCVDLMLRRLMARVNITIDHSDMNSGGSETSFFNSVVKVHRAARNIYPFAEGGSAAGDVGDLYAEVADYQVVSNGYDDVSEKLTLYIPENMQGNLLDGNDDSWEKTESSDDFDASLCTYISLEGVKDGSVDGVEGDFIYRFFPGEDNTMNFDLQGNKAYDISMELTWEGMYVTNNWKVEKSNWSDARMIQVSTSEDEGYSSEVSLEIPRGTADVPVFIYYSPHGMPYESEYDGGEAHHYDRGWVFMPRYSLSDGSSATVPKSNESEFTGVYMNTGFVRHDDYRTIHYITIPESAAVGYTNRILYQTVDGRRKAWLDVTVTDTPDSPGLSVGDEADAGGGNIEY